MNRVLFVCLGNICRSPMAEGVFRRAAEVRGLLPLLEIDSAGTGAWHIGNPPDARARDAAAQRGIDISGQRARQVGPEDFEVFDLIVAMDRSNLASLARMAPPDLRSKIRLFLDFAPDAGADEVPDPYYGGEDGFTLALDLIENAAQGLAEYIADSRS